MKSGAALVLGLSLACATGQAEEAATAKGFVVSVDFGVAPGNLDRLKELNRINAAASVADEPGCRRFYTYELPTSPNHLFLFEVYDDEAAFKLHLQSPHYRKFYADSLPIITSRSALHGDLLSTDHKAP